MVTLRKKNYKRRKMNDKIQTKKSYFQNFNGVPFFYFVYQGLNPTLTVKDLQKENL